MGESKIKLAEYRLGSDISSPIIKVANSENDLGVIFDIDLKFDSHIAEVCDIRPEWTKCNLCSLGVFSSEPSELTVLSD